jgi:hypothetical protein
MRMRWLSCLLALCAPLALAWAAGAGPRAESGRDMDLDDVPDLYDNCLTVSNADQADQDHDGCGDVCDGDLPISCDLDGDGVVGGRDALRLFADFGCVSEGSGECPGDCTGDGATSGRDFTRISVEFGRVLGPSCVKSVSRSLEECPLPSDPAICNPPLPE